jgi:hypothetical protein
MRKPFTVLLAVSVLGAATVVVATTLARPAEALCLTQSEDGKWHADPNSGGLARIELRFICQDQVHNGQLYPPGPPWYIHVWGTCHPTNCDWGEVPAQRLSSGHIYATYDQGYARRYVYVKMSSLHPGQLWVWTYTDFADSGRRDYSRSDWFTRD